MKTAELNGTICHIPEDDDVTPLRAIRDECQRSLDAGEGCDWRALAAAMMYESHVALGRLRGKPVEIERGAK